MPWAALKSHLIRLELGDLHASASSGLGLKACAIMPGIIFLRQSLFIGSGGILAAPGEAFILYVYVCCVCAYVCVAAPCSSLVDAAYENVEVRIASGVASLSTQATGMELRSLLPEPSCWSSSINPEPHHKYLLAACQPSAVVPSALGSLRSQAAAACSFLCGLLDALMSLYGTIKDNPRSCLLGVTYTSIR